MEMEHQAHTNMTTPPFTFFEFFAGGGMAWLGFGSEWKCTFANDWCEKKAAAYRAYFGGSELRVCSVAHLTASDLLSTPTLVWEPLAC